jgi:hypothetical protein
MFDARAYRTLTAIGLLLRFGQAAASKAALVGEVTGFGRTLAHNGFLSGVSGIAAQPCFIAVHEFG